MANILICCGGTGAHVALAFMRLHAVGHPLGYFHHRDRQPLKLPSIYLVDQDNGDGAERDTAWQALRRVIGSHPSRSQWGDTPGKQREPSCHEITPLPVGANHDWFNQSRDRLASRFENSDYLACMMSPEQRQIRFSHGMMGSPAVGSLLFKLKVYDKGSDNINYDTVFETLLRQRGRIAVVGSGVGGTGSSVAPTLAQILADDVDNDVMAIMVLNWFRLNDDPGNVDSTTVMRAQARNRDMVENASSGFAYYGRKLANRVATVPIGVPEDALITRNFVGDTRQPLQEAYSHAVAALCCMLQYLDKAPYPPALYHMGAADPRKFGGGNHVPGGTVQSMANQGELLAETAKVLARVLINYSKGGLIDPAICEPVAKCDVDPRAVGKNLQELASEYQSHLDWLYETLGVKRELQEGLSRDMDVRTQLAQSRLAFARGSRAEDVAGEVFQWIARWIQVEEHGKSDVDPRSQMAQGIYWPALQKPGLSPPASEAGRLKKLPQDQVSAIVEGFVDPKRISQNGWPDAFAAASYFQEAIERMDGIALRKLELLMAGLVEGKLEIRRIGHGDPRSVSLDRIVDQERKDSGYGSLAKYSLVGLHQLSGAEQIFGFSSPYTLFCAAPGVPDAMWGSLWADLTGFKADDWKSCSVSSWGRADTIVGKIRAWVTACSRRNPHTTPPVWTHIFRGVTVSPKTYGVGKKFELDWDRVSVKVYLPAMESGNYEPSDDSIPEGNAGLFLKEHDRVLDDSGYMQYKVVKFRIPGEDSDSEVQGIWKEHLERLQAEGAILAFGSDPESRKVHIVSHLDGDGERIVLLDTLLLERESIMVPRMIPMLQDRVPGRKVAQEVLYPDIPLGSDYIGLVCSSNGGCALDLLKRGERVTELGPSIQRRKGGNVAVWNLPMLGRADDLSITLQVPDKKSFHSAHWMIWPRFRAIKPTPWRTYYVYEHCTDPRLHVETLFLDPDRDRVMRSRNDTHDRLSYPVSYDARRRIHTGGPPIALNLRHTTSDEELGVYVVSLDNLKNFPESIRLGIDFGTSHTVGAIAVGESAPEQISLEPELDTEGSPALSQHVSQNWRHVTAAATDLGLLRQSVWVPTYVKDVKEDLRSLLPTELLTIERCDALSAKPIDTWVPMLDFVVPPVGISREDFVHHVIANFKWDTATAFRGHEMELRTIYLDRIVELFTAEALALHGRPNDPIDFTFTYPLRTPSDDVQRYVQMLREVLDRGSSSFGCHLRLTHDVGVFDESHATRVGTKKFGEVCIVGDLGGGTLDLIISSEGKPGMEFEEAVDSVRIGGNLLLQMLARDGAEMLPRGWASDSEARATQLVAWMRTLGAKRLFGRQQGRAPVIEELGLRGFDTSEKTKPGRELIHRYFYLVGEYMARCLTAYVADHWYPQVHRSDWNELKILLYLRGNGWRLWPGSEEYAGIQQVIADRLAARLRDLWKLLPDEELPEEPGNCISGGSVGHPKRDPVLRVVGKSRPHGEVRDKWLSYVMVDLRLLLKRGERRIQWYDRIPFRTGGKTVKLQLEGVSPVIPLSSPHAAQRLHLDGLGHSGEFAINNWLETKGEFVGPDQLDFHAPVGALVWEAAFKSDRLRKGDED